MDFMSPNDPALDGDGPYYKVMDKRVPMKPYGNFPPAGLSHKEAVEAKHKAMQSRGLKWEEILNGYTPEFKFSHCPYTSFNAKPKGTDWFTWGPYHEGKRKAGVQEVQAAPMAPTGVGPFTREYDASEQLFEIELEKYQEAQRRAQVGLKITKYYGWEDKQIPKMGDFEGGDPQGGSPKFTRYKSAKKELRITRYLVTKESIIPRVGDYGPKET